MSDRAVATKLVLQALNQDETISTIDDRTRIQKIIYLVQASDVPLGYNFSWYLKGPYCSPLAKDYYNLPSNVGDKSLKQEILPRLNKVNSIIQSPNRPENMNLTNWLELIASVHYLISSSRLDAAGIIAKMQREKPHLAEYTNTARDVIEDVFNLEAKEAD